MGHVSFNLTFTALPVGLNIFINEWLTHTWNRSRNVLDVKSAPNVLQSHTLHFCLETGLTNGRKDRSVCWWVGRLVGDGRTNDRAVHVAHGTINVKENAQISLSASLPYHWCSSSNALKDGKLNCLKTGDRWESWSGDGCRINSSRRAGDNISYG
jgi:hypothetical protein